MAHELRNKEKVTLNFENVQNVFQYLAFAVITYVQADKYIALPSGQYSIVIA